MVSQAMGISLCNRFGNSSGEFILVVLWGFCSFPKCGSDLLVSWPSIFLEIAQIRPFITPLKSYIRNPLDPLKRYVRIENKETIVHCCRNLCLSLHPFVPSSTSVFFPSFPFSCELDIKRWRIEVVEAQVGDSVSLVRRRAVRGCHL